VAEPAGGAPPPFTTDDLLHGDPIVSGIKEALLAVHTSRGLVEKSKARIDDLQSKIDEYAGVNLHPDSPTFGLPSPTAAAAQSKAMHDLQQELENLRAWQQQQGEYIQTVHERVRSAAESGVTDLGDNVLVELQKMAQDDAARLPQSPPDPAPAPDPAHSPHGAFQFRATDPPMPDVSAVAEPSLSSPSPIPLDGPGAGLPSVEGRDLPGLEGVAWNEGAAEVEMDAALAPTGAVPQFAVDAVIVAPQVGPEPDVPEPDVPVEPSEAPSSDLLPAETSELITVDDTPADPTEVV
jgi:hypothetical protein